MTLAKIALASGRSIQLTSLELSSTYGVWLEGYPNAQMNNAKLEHLAKRREFKYRLLPTHLIAPPRRYPETRPGPRPFGPVELLPSVYCEASFESNRINEKLDPVLYRSWLVVVWFQDDLVSPVAEFVTAAVRDLAWDEHAEDYEL